MNEKQLLELKNQIEETKAKMAELHGKEKHLLSELKDQYSCDSVMEAEGKLKALDKKIELLESQLESNLTKIEEQHPDL